MSEWRKAKAQLPCGCYVQADVISKLTDEVALIHYGATFSFGMHTEDHRAICAEHDTFFEGEDVMWMDDLPHSRDWLGDV